MINSLLLAYSHISYLLKLFMFNSLTIAFIDNTWYSFLDEFILLSFIVPLHPWHKRPWVICRSTRVCNCHGQRRWTASLLSITANDDRWDTGYTRKWVLKRARGVRFCGGKKNPGPLPRDNNDLLLVLSTGAPGRLTRTVPPLFFHPHRNKWKGKNCVWKSRDSWNDIARDEEREECWMYGHCKGHVHRSECDVSWRDGRNSPFCCCWRCFDGERTARFAWVIVERFPIWWVLWMFTVLNFKLDDCVFSRQ